jgi:hypothetical protein
MLRYGREASTMSNDRPLSKTDLEQNLSPKNKKRTS